MKETNKNDNEINMKQNDNLKDISFLTFGVLIFFTGLLSIIIAILYIVLTPWKYVKKIFKIISIISLCLIILQLVISVPTFYKTKNIQSTTSLSLLSQELSLINILLILYILIIVINIFMAAYVSIKLNIADYPEYGGRTRNEEYIKNHPNEFGDISSGEFLVAALLPSLCSFFSLLSLIFCFCFRKKISDLYNISNKNANEFLRRASITRRNSIVRRSSVAKRSSISKRHSILDVDDKKINDDTDKRKNSNNEMKNEDTKEEKKEDDLDFEYNKELPEEFYFGGMKIEANSEENDTEGGNINKENSNKNVKKRRISVVNNLMVPQTNDVD